MNILFLLKSTALGGVEVVTSVLANKFANEGHHVGVFSFLTAAPSVAERLSPRVKVYIQGSYAASQANVEALRKILIDDKVEVIINQWGLPYTPIKTIKKAAKGLDVKVISVYHNAPSFNGRIQKLNIKLMGCEIPIKRMALQLMCAAFKKVTSRAMAYAYKQSDRYLVLSDSYIAEFQKFTGLSDTPKLSVMTNPVTISSDGYTYAANNKWKEVIYVGRLDFVQKRVYRVIDTWNYIESRFPDWHLTIVGDGEDRHNLKRHAEVLELKHISFEGFQQPMEYYKRASILILTSDFEGFPLVLAECMSFGVVPVVYNSYSAVGDIITDQQDGIVLPYHEDGYKADEAASLLGNLMKDGSLRNRMALATIEKSKNYSIDSIYKEWMNVFEQL